MQLVPVIVVVGTTARLDDMLDGAGGGGGEAPGALQSGRVPFLAKLGSLQAAQFASVLAMSLLRQIWFHGVTPGSVALSGMTGPQGPMGLRGSQLLSDAL